MTPTKGGLGNGPVLLAFWPPSAAPDTAAARLEKASSSRSERLDVGTSLANDPVSGTLGEKPLRHGKHRGAQRMRTPAFGVFLCFSAFGSP